MTVRMSRDLSDIHFASAHFLDLEAKGWKGKRGTALAVAPRHAAFAREMIENLANEGKCRIISVEVNGAPIAMGIILVSGDWGFFWKTAYDEELAEFSPGVQLTVELSRALLADTKIATTDSCACADHPMIDHLWSERMPIGDVFISVAADRSKRFAFAVICEHLRRDIRSRLKIVFNGLRRRLGV